MGVYALTDTAVKFSGGQVYIIECYLTAEVFGTLYLYFPLICIVYPAKCGGNNTRQERVKRLVFLCSQHFCVAEQERSNALCIVLDYGF